MEQCLEALKFATLMLPIENATNLPSFEFLSKLLHMIVRITWRCVFGNKENGL